MDFTSTEGTTESLPVFQVQMSVLDGIQEQLKQIRVYGVEKVITYLSYRAQRIPNSEVRTHILNYRTHNLSYRAQRIPGACPQP